MMMIGGTPYPAPALAVTIVLVFVVSWPPTIGTQVDPPPPTTAMVVDD